MDRPYRVRRVFRRWKRKFSEKMNPQELETIEESLNQVAAPSNRIIINVGGVRFETYRSTLRNIPDTRLSWITESKTGNPDYDPFSGEYFFDRHPNMFLMILNYYRTGKLHAPTDVCGPVFEDELAFWGIDEKQIESCCWGSYSQHRDAQKTLQELKIDTGIMEDDQEEDTNFGSSTAEKFGILEDVEVKKSKWEIWRPRSWAFLDDPYSSTASKIYTGISMFFVVAVITTFCLETHMRFRELKNISQPLTPNMTYKQVRESTKPVEWLSYIEVVCMIFFTIELFARFICCPSKTKFFKSFLNWIDILSLLPFYIVVPATFANPELENNATFNAIINLRFIRVFRIFKVIQHFEGLKILFHTLKASATELLLMIMLILMMVIIFAVSIYYAEQVEESDKNFFDSIPIAFWWAVVTMTTLGYGDKVPQTALGYVVGGFCAILGVLFVALPIPIIVNNFAIYYTHAKAQAKLPKKRKHALVGAADALKQVLDPSIAEEETFSSSSSWIDNTDGRRDQSNYTHASSPSSLERELYSVNEKNGKKSAGITVTYTDAETEQNNNSIAASHFGMVNGHANGNIFKDRTGLEDKPTVFMINRETKLKDLTSPNRGHHKLFVSSTPTARRGSIMPGAVPLSANSSKRFGNIVSNQRAAGPRERRRSLIPSSPLYTA